MAVPLVEATRGALIETVHRGDIAVVRADGQVVWSAGEPTSVSYMRSSAKPIQATAAVQTGAVDRFGLSERELAVLCASHGGEPFHVEAVRSILQKLGLDEGALGCGAHAPSYGPAAVALYRTGGSPSALHNNCSGKHSGMLAAALALGAPTQGYLEPDHPVQQHILANIALYSGVPKDEVVVAIDGCSAPVFGLSVLAMARMFATLADPCGPGGDHEIALRRIRTAMMAHPEMVAGTARFDTDLMAAGAGRIVSKGGAEGVHCVALPELGLGIAVKIEGGRGEAASVATMEVLRGLGALDSAAMDRLAHHRLPPIRNVGGVTVGEMHPVVTFGS